MFTWLPRRFACLVLVLPIIPVVAAADDAEIARLLKQLGDDKFHLREAASKRLAEIGEPALDALHKATTSDDPEVRRRAEDIVAVLEKKLYGEHCLTGHAGTVWAVSVSADGKRLLTSGDDKTLRLWDTDTGNCLRVFKGHTDLIIGAALSGDGKRVLSGSSDRTVRLWDATTGKELRKYEGHTDQVLSVAFGPEGQALSGGEDRTMILWDLNTGKKVRVFTGHPDWVRMVASSGEAKLAATSGVDQSIRLWDLETGKELRKLVTGYSERHDTSVCFSPDGKRLLSAGGDLSVRLWDVATGKELMRIKDAHAYCAAFSPDGTRLVSGGHREDTTVRVWDTKTGKELCKYEGHAGIVTSVAFFPDGKRLASASLDGTGRIWRAPR